MRTPRAKLDLLVDILQPKVFNLTDRLVAVEGPRSITMKNSGTAWQRSLLPLMAGVLIVAALFFASQSVFEFSDFKSRVQPPKADLSAIFDRFEQAEDTKSTISRESQKS